MCGFSYNHDGIDAIIEKAVCIGIADQPEAPKIKTYFF
jgi:hypothetical protein